MNALLENPMAHNMAVCLLHSLWQGTVVAVLLLLVLRLIRNKGAAFRYHLSCIALLVTLLWPVVTFLELHSQTFTRIIFDSLEPHMIYNVEPDDSSVAVMQQKTSPFVEIREDTQLTQATTFNPFKSWSWWSWVIVAWLTGVMALAGFRMLGWYTLLQWRRSAMPLTGAFADMANRLKQRMGLESRVRVCWSDKVMGPVVFGCIKPVVLLPMSLMTGFTAAQIEMIMAHEFAHVKRHDYLVNLLQTATEIILFFNPAVWWINHQIRKEREHACDDMAVRVTGSSVGYVQALVALAEHQLSESNALAMAASKGQGELYARVKRLIHLQAAKESNFSPASSAWVTVITCVLMLSMVSPGTATGEAIHDDVPVRGAIKDRNGVLLAVSDVEVIDLTFDLNQVVEAYRKNHGGIVPTRNVLTPDATSDESKILNEVDIVKIFDETVISELQKHELAESYHAQSARVHFRRLPDLPWVYQSGLSEALVTQLRSLKLIDQLPGAKLQKKMQRRYPFANVTSHVLGYLSLPDQDIITDPDVGVSGIEKGANNELTPLTDDQWKPGSDIYLTLDIRHQLAITKVLSGFRSSALFDNEKVERGAVVLMDVQTGNVLAMVSLPNFDPHLFTPMISQSDFKMLLNDSAKPMLDRSTKSFAPGATILPITCLAGIAGGVDGQTFRCEGSVTYGNRAMKCWLASKGEKHGDLKMREGLAVACNCYFYQMGNATGIEKMNEIGTVLGFGQSADIEIANDKGIIPGPKWLKENQPNEKWSAGYTANTAIGQGLFLASPLQLTVAYAAIANGGTVWKSRMVDRIVSHGDTEKTEVLPLRKTANLKDHGVTEEGLKTIQLGLEDGVQKTTARLAKSEKIRIAGRTGTAQYWRPDGSKDNHVWFCGYAPADKPRWALTIMVQGGHAGGSVGAPLAKEIFEQIAAIEAGELEINLTPVMEQRRGVTE